jgi:outer membrane protein TolC
VSSQQRIALLRRRLAVQQQLVDRIEHRVQAGAASQADAMLQRLVLLGTEAELADAERNHAGTRAQVAAVIGVPGRALDGFELAYPLGLLDDPVDALEESDARRRALLERADVLTALDGYAASEAALRLELAKQWPDLHLGSGYQFDQGQNKWGLSVSLDLPVMNQNQGPIAEAVAARSEAAARFVALQAQVIAELDQGFAQLGGNREQVGRFEALVAEQQRAAARVSAARAEGAADRSAELAAAVEMQRSEITLLEARLALDRTRAQLEAAVQGPLAMDGDALRSATPRATQEKQ